MSILGIGIDIIDNQRVKKLLSKKKNNFEKKVFTNKEIALCGKRSNVVNCFSKRFSAKEAFVKALGTGFNKNINFKDIEVLKKTNGKPYIVLNKKLTLYIRHLFKVNKLEVFLSITDEKKYSIASVIISKQ